MNIAYLQCDCRYNKWLLKKIEDKYVVEHTVERMKQLGCKTIVAGIYKCDVNGHLIEILKKTEAVKVIISDEENVNIRFLEIVTKESADYVIRVGGDQVLFDVEKTLNIVNEMNKTEQEWFYEAYANCILPDIVSLKSLKENLENLRGQKRYFDGLEKCNNIKRYKLPFPILVTFNFRVNSNESLRICKKIISNQLDIYELSKKLMQRLTSNNYLMQTGLWGSWLLSDENQDFFYDENQEINPWWGRTTIDFLKVRLNKSLSVFEWGAGNSTLFWSKNVGDVVSIEYDKEWFEKLKTKIPENVKLRYTELDYDGNYCKAIIQEDKKFDIVLIDGRDRVRCAKNAVERLKEDGIIIWDDSGRDYYGEGIRFLKENGFKCLQLESVGYKSVGVGHLTSIFYKNKNILGL